MSFICNIKNKQTALKNIKENNTFLLSTYNRPVKDNFKDAKDYIDRGIEKISLRDYAGAIQDYEYAKKLYLKRNDTESSLHLNDCINSLKNIQAFCWML